MGTERALISRGWIERLTVMNGLTACLAISAIALYASRAAGTVHASLLLGAALYQRWRWSGNGGPATVRRWWWEAAAFGTLVFFVVDLFVVSRNLIGAALRLLGFIVAYHADNPQSARGARQTLALTFIQMLAASASTTEVSFSFLMAAYLTAALWTLAALGVAEKEGTPPPLSPRAPATALRAPLMRLTAAAAPGAVALGLGVFFCVPHYGTGYFREAGGALRREVSGFSDRIELGSIGSIKKSHATVMRVKPSGPDGSVPLPLRMRGIALDAYDGRTWTVSDPHKRWLAPDATGVFLVAPEKVPREEALAGAAPASSGPRKERRREARWLALDVLLEPLDAPVIFAPPETVNVTMTRFQSLAVDRQGTLYASALSSRRFTYRTASLRRRGAPIVASGDVPPEGAERYLQIPPLDPRIPELARDVTRALASPETKARALEKHLREGYAYSLDVNDAAVASPLGHFLIEKRPGHCEYFATSLAILLRTLGIPSRVVNGFYGGEPSGLTGLTILRQADAHSWVEAWMPGEGWITLDPTPADAGALAPWDLFGRLRRLKEETEIAWDTWIVGLDLEDQRNVLEEVRDRVDLALAAAVLQARSLLTAAEELAGRPGRFLLPAIAAAAFAAMVFVMMLAIRAILRWFSAERPAHRATELFARFERAVSKRGLRRDPWTTPAAFARAAGAPGVASSFEEARYGPASMQEAALARLRHRISEHAAERRRGA